LDLAREFTETDALKEFLVVMESSDRATFLESGDSRFGTASTVGTSVEMPKRTFFPLPAGRGGFELCGWSP
jgi:hypothetical protein